MPDLLLELFSEEIPSRFQKKAAEDLRKLVTDALVENGLVYEGAKAFVTPRRLTLTVHGLPARSPDRREERKGPRIDAPDKAIEGFVKAAGLKSISEAKVQPDKKGDFYVAVIDKPGRPASAAIAEIVTGVIRGFPWPKSMRWGEASAKPGSLTWVRPLHSILCTFGPETEETEIVDLDAGGVRAGRNTHGHRFLAPGEITVRRFDDYVKKLESAKVILDSDRRRDVILDAARELALVHGLELIEDDALAEEVAGLVEWPAVLVGSFDKAFLDIPPEVIRATIRQNQKCFVLREAKTGRLASKFILVANTEASDGGKAIVAGNERVIRARLADARFFWDTDRKTKLEDRLPKLDAIVFHEKLGTQGERIRRIERLAGEIAPLVGADPEKAARAARLAKADLVTEMVGEFPELQGLMGRYYATAEGEDKSVATAIEDHYKPLGPSDRVPTDPVAIAVGLADKLDTLIGFFAIDEKPTGSKDPYALRRAAIGVVRIILDNALLFRGDALYPAFYEGILWPHYATVVGDYSGNDEELVRARTYLQGNVPMPAARSAPPEASAEGFTILPGDSPPGWRKGWQVTSDVWAFLADRLKVHLRDQGARHDLVDAVLSLDNQDDLLLITRCVQALGKFLDSDDGKNLLAGYKRATNILREEEKKSGEKFLGAVDAKLLSEPEEKKLAAAVEDAETAASRAVGSEDFAAAMAALAKLRGPVDAFFDKVLVNAPNPAVRANRLRLLNRIREATLAVADFSKVGG